MIDKSALPTVMAVLKVLEANYIVAHAKADFNKVGYNQRIDFRRHQEARRVIEILSEKEKEAFRAVMLSMILMTAGSVETVRNPDLYKADKIDPISRLMTDYTRGLWKYAGGEDPASYIPTKKDYTTAKNLLPIVSSIPSDRRKILQIMKDKKLLGDPKKTAGEEDIKIAQVLYRGLHSISNQVLMYLFYVDKPSWDITRSVSTSEDVETSISFTKGKDAQKGDGWKLLFKIQNDDRRGFDVGNLSFYGGEDEYLLSGILNIDAIGFKLQAVDTKTGASEYMNIYKSAGSDLNIDFLGKTYRGKDASNIFLSIMQDTESDENIYDDFGKIMGSKISIFRIGKRKYSYDKRTLIHVNASVQTN